MKYGLIVLSYYLAFKRYKPVNILYKAEYLLDREKIIKIKQEVVI